ncbi:MAG: hypothetical protein ACKO5C_05035 [Ferruginibacter sp.]
MTQKLFFSVLGLLSFMFVSTSAFAQNSAGVEDVTGVYQLMGGKKELKGKDVGDKKNANNAMFVVLFDDGTAYSFFAKSLAEVNKAKVNALISSGAAVKGDH